MESEEIIYFLPYSHGGVSSFVRNLLEYRPKSDIYYKIIQYRLKERNTPDFDMRFNANEHIIFDYSGKENLYTVFRRLKKHISSQKSILVANDGLEFRMANALKLPNPLVYIVHGNIEYYYQISKIYNDIIDKYICVSEFINKTLSTKITGNSKIFTEYVPVKKIEDKIKPHISKINIAYTGFLSESKGSHLFKEICNYLSAKKIEFEFSIIGNGNLYELLTDEFKNNSNVKLIGQVPNSHVLNILQKCDVFLFPSFSEGMPVSVIEAMKCDCVPVVSDIPSGIPELIFDGVTGFKVPVGDTKQFAEKIAYLANNPKVRKEMSKNAKNHADKMFDPHEQAKKYETLIINTKPDEKTFKQLPLGRILNKPYLPNFLVKTIRKIIKHPKL
jgi:glycosyltransferase involved in cell wall biosynthesis